METTESSSAQAILFTAGALLLPFLVLAAWLLVSRQSNSQLATGGDWLALGFATASGAFCVWKLCNHFWSRVVATIFYVPACGVVLFFFTLLFVCEHLEIALEAASFCIRKGHASLPLSLSLVVMFQVPHPRLGKAIA